MDPCLELVNGARVRERWTLRHKLMAAPLRPMFLYADTPQERIERAVQRELSDLSRRALSEAGDLSPAAREALARGETEGYFPRRELERLRLPTLDVWIDKHKRLEQRLRWLLNPEVTRGEIDRLDPLEDADQLTCFVKYEFRPEFLYCAWANAIERIAQSEAASTFFHATGAAEATPVKRTEDTLIHYYYFFNWGPDSYHGRKAIESMNSMHGRYFIHNDGMKYVLLNGAFSVLDSLAVIGHRPLHKNERLGYFHTHVNMGQGMNIQNLTHDWDEMYSWFQGMNKALSGFAPQKRRMWLSIEDNFDRDAKVPGWFSRFRRTMEISAMDDTFRSALGFERPSDRTIAFCRAVVRGVNRYRAALPRGPYIESLQSFFTYPDGVEIETAGVKARSPRMPTACPFHMTKPAASIDPENQRPLLKHTDAPERHLRVFTWDEVRRHDHVDDLWVVFGGHVYDLTPFAKNHPGGLEILLNGSGRDMTDEFEDAGHSELTKVFALNFRIGTIEDAAPVSYRRDVQVEARA
jgi:hypothetical protein